MRRLTLAAVLVAFAGCASPGTPPGGPVDADAPQLVAVRPDTNAHVRALEPWDSTSMR